MGMGTDKMRLFVAVEFPAAILAALAALQREIRGKVERGRFKRSENFHLTLKFLGETPSETVDRLVERLSEAAKNQKEFSLRLGEVGIFGPRPPIRVIWQGLAGDTDRLGSLQKAVEVECAAIGFAPEKRPYSPHITLAQDVIPLPGKTYLPENGAALPFTVREFALVLSEERDRKRIYTLLHCFPLISG
jgi:2'-5' RNA ligase